MFLQTCIPCCSSIFSPLHREALPNRPSMQLHSWCSSEIYPWAPFFLSHSTDTFSLRKLTHFHGINYHLFVHISNSHIFRFPVFPHNLRTLRDISTWLSIHFTPFSKLSILFILQISSWIFSLTLAFISLCAYLITFCPSYQTYYSAATSRTLEMFLKHVEEHKQDKCNDKEQFLR